MDVDMAGLAAPPSSLLSMAAILAALDLVDGADLCRPG
jgi:hypothetical protein